MSTTIIKVIIDSDKLVFRDIAIASNENLEALHFAILKAFDFNGKEMASFIKSDDNLDIEEEFPLVILIDGSEDKLMADTKINSLLANKGDVLSYVYDYLNEWNFDLEVIEINDEETQEAKVIRSYGEAPKENERNISGDDASNILMEEILGDEFYYEEEEGDEDLFDSGFFDSIDDYEEFL